MILTFRTSLQLLKKRIYDNKVDKCHLRSEFEYFLKEFVIINFSSDTDHLPTRSLQILSTSMLDFYIKHSEIRKDHRKRLKNRHVRDHVFWSRYLLV